MKRLTAIMLSFTLLLCLLAGCGGSKEWKGTHHVEMEVDGYGVITVEINADAAPITASNFLNLAKKGFYSNNSFYRVIPGFGIYGGDPNGNGSGTSGTTITGEFTANGVNNPLSNTAGAIGMARGMHYDSASCQFYILASDATYLDGDFAVFGYVTNGFNVVQQICATVPTNGADGYVSAVSQPVIKGMTVLD